LEPYESLGLTVTFSPSAVGVNNTDLSFHSNDPDSIQTVAVTGSGTSTTGVADALPTVHRLYQNSPNPFQRATRTAFDLPEPGKVTLKVFDLSGREVRVLADAWYPAGNHEVIWNARDAAGHPVAGGIYFLHMEVGSFEATKRMYLRK